MAEVFLDMLTRRTTFLLAAMLPIGRVRSAAAQAAPASAPPSAPAPASGPYVLPALSYAADANEPSIDAQTMTLHHDRHHAAYVANLNAAVRDLPGLAAMPVQQLLLSLDQVPETARATVRNNAGGHANHTMFWQVMGGKGGAPSGDLSQAVERDFGSLDALKMQFNRAGAGQFGSGWVFVTVDRAGKLALTTRPNQDTPLMDAAARDGTRVLFGNDVWEHAYYLKYQNRRPDYLAAWWNVVNWDAVAARYAAARAGTLDV